MAASDFEARLAQLTPEQRALLERRLAELPARARPASIVRGDANTGPASFAQKRMWFLEQLAPGTPRYNVNVAFRLRGPLDVEALREAVRGLGQRHEILRTRLIWADAEPVQVIDGADAVTLDVRDGVDTERAIDLATAEARRPFDLAAEPPFRALLVRTAADDALLALTVHHAAIDGVSLAVLSAELSTLYAAASGRRAAALPQPAIRYVDFAAWEARQLAGGAFEPHVAYWSARIRPDLPPSTFPADRARPDRAPTRGDVYERTVPEGLADAVATFARRRSATPFMVLLAAFAVQLRRYASQDRVVIAVPTAGRPLPETQRIVGLFVNTLPLALDVPLYAPFEEVAGAARAAMSDAMAHDVPFDLLVQRLAPRRRANGAPIADVMFAHQTDMAPRIDLAGVQCTPVPLKTGAVKFDLMLETTVDRRGMRTVWTYADELYDRSTVERFADSYLTLLAAALENPSTPIGDLAGGEACAPPTAVDVRDLEAVLQRHPAVRTCAVVRFDGDGERRFVAYVVAAPGCSAAELSAYVAGELHGVVAAIHIEDDVPAHEPFVAPRDGIETALAALWEELLDVRPIGVRDNFFALGGHSLLAARMAARVESRFGTRLPVARLFEAQTIEALADMVRTGEDAPIEPVLLLQAGAARTPLFFLHGDYGGGGLYCARLADGLGRDQPLYAVRPHGRDDDGDVPPVAVMAAERLRAIRAIRPHGPYLLGGYCIGGAVAYEIARLLHGAGEEVPLLALVDAPLQLRDVPVLRGALRITAAVRRWPPDRERAVYVRWQRRVRYFERLSNRERAAWLRRGLLRAGGAAGENLEAQLEQRYGESIAGYTPAPYAGRVLMINSRTTGDARRTQVTDWTRLAPAARVHVIDADHASLVRDHAAAIGERIRREIDAV